jgi:hypothetical protein
MGMRSDPHSSLLAYVGYYLYPWMGQHEERAFCITGTTVPAPGAVDYYR